MKKTENNASGTSFHNVTFEATPAELIEILGEPSYDYNDGSDKVNLEWVCETENGDVFTIYDWKYYRSISIDEVVEWHIGSHTGKVSMEALTEIESELIKF